jgi:hypothetical protein
MVYYFVKIYPHISAKNEQEIKRQGKCNSEKVKTYIFFSVER